jgi:hypothetical protein
MTALPRLTLRAPEAPSLNTQNWISSPRIAGSKARACG